MKILAFALCLFAAIGCSQQSSWTYFNSKTYYIETDRGLTWHQAVDDCTERGMTLLSIHSQQESDNLRSYLVSINQQSTIFWTSGNCLAEDKKWMWAATGLPLAYTNWQVGEPNYSNNEEKCIVTDSAWKWNDINCSYYNFRFICESIEVDGYVTPVDDPVNPPTGPAANPSPGPTPAATPNPAPGPTPGPTTGPNPGPGPVDDCV